MCNRETEFRKSVEEHAVTGTWDGCSSMCRSCDAAGAGEGGERGRLVEKLGIGGAEWKRGPTVSISSSSRNA